MISRFGEEPPSIFCADIGSLLQGNFGWAKGESGKIVARGSEITDLTDQVAGDLQKGRAVTLGFECPLYLPLRSDVEKIRKARDGEGDRPWSAGAGRGVLIPGLYQSVWLLQAIQKKLDGQGRGFVDWERFQQEGAGLFLWEAFVSGDAKAPDDVLSTHAEDAAIAVRSFMDALPDPWSANAVREEEPYSLIGATLLRTGWSEDLGLLSQPCLVIRS